MEDSTPVQMETQNNTPNKMQEPLEQNFGFASFGRRLGAYLVDWIILTPVGLIYSYFYITYGPTINSSAYYAYNYLISISISALFFIILWIKLNGQTPGKKLFKIRIIRQDGSPIDAKTAALRFLGYIVSSIPLGLGFIWILLDENKEGWHDKIAKTQVVKLDTESKAGIGLMVFIVWLVVLFFQMAWGMKYGLDKLGQDGAENPWVDLYQETQDSQEDVDINLNMDGNDSEMTPEQQEQFENFLNQLYDQTLPEGSDVNVNIN